MPPGDPDQEETFSMKGGNKYIYIYNYIYALEQFNYDNVLFFHISMFC